MEGRRRRNVNHLQREHCSYMYMDVSTKPPYFLSQNVEELTSVDEDLDSISAHIDYVQENIVELQNDLIALDDSKVAMLVQFWSAINVTMSLFSKKSLIPTSDTSSKRWLTKRIRQTLAHYFC